MAAVNKGKEYTVCFNTANRNQTTYPQPNDFIMPLASAGNASSIPPVTQMYMGSIELPVTQWTIESGWATLLFDQGIVTEVNSLAELPNATFYLTITPAGGSPTVLEVAVPPNVNNIVGVVADGPTAAIFTTELPHGLVAAPSWAPIELEGTVLTDPAVIGLNMNPNLTIIDAVTFRLAGLPPATPPADLMGYVRASPPNPQELADALTTALRAAVMGLVPLPMVQMLYNANTNVFTLTYDDGLAAQTFVTLTHPASSLSTHMGFGMGAMLSPDGVTPTSQAVIGNYNNSGCLSNLSFQPGNYTAESFAAAFERAWNPFVFNGGCAADPADRPVFAFTNAAGMCFDFPIDYGTYTPDTFAAYLASNMAAADPSQTYTVTYVAANQTLHFESNLPFGLPFDDSVVTPSLVARLGFDPICYNGAMSYVSRSLGYAPSLCTPTPLLRSGNLRVLMKAPQSTYCFVFCGTPCQSAVMGGGDTIGPLPLAHGFQVGDFVNLTTAAGDMYTLPIIAVPDAFTFTVDPYASGIMAGDTVAVCGTASTGASLNLYLNTNPMLAEILGFPATAVFSQSDGVLAAPYCWNFNGPPYLLWVIQEPSGSRYIHHYWRAKDDNKENIFAKLVLRTNVYSIERLYPMQQIMQGNQKVTQLKMAIYNPDHSLYNFHGKNWSGTLSFIALASAGELLCA